MDHPSNRLLARYALAEVTNEDELTALEDHLMGCEDCRRRAVTLDSMGTNALENNDQPALHIAKQTAGEPVPLCGQAASRNVISEVLVPGMNAAALCVECLSLWRTQPGQASLRPN